MREGFRDRQSWTGKGRLRRASAEELPTGDEQFVGLDFPSCCAVFEKTMEEAVEIDIHCAVGAGGKMDAVEAVGGGHRYRLP